MDTQNIYYCYVYKRKDGTPYYIGKGKGSRAFITNGRIVSPPRDRNNIFFACEGVSETEAFEMETALISLLGRKDLGTGILWNRTDGGEGISNPGEGTRQKIVESNKRRIVSKKTRLKMSKSHKGRTYSEETIQRMREGSTGKKHPEGSKSKEGKKGENNHNSKLTDVQRIEIYQRWKSGELQKDLAIYYHVAFCTIQRTIKKLKS